MGHFEATKYPNVIDHYVNFFGKLIENKFYFTYLKEFMKSIDIS